MLDDCIKRKNAISYIRKYGVGCFDPDDFTPECAERFVIDLLKKVPAEEVLPAMAFRQVMWERDVALMQLKEIGKGLGERMDDVREVSQGIWRFHRDGSATCSKCGRRQNTIWDMDRWQKYCGDCGAEMIAAELET